MAQTEHTRPRGVIVPPADPLIGWVREQCSECWGCVRHCPARALRVVSGHTEVITERCVQCGACVTECGNAGHAVRDDLPLVREALRSDAPVVALLASEHIAALHPRTSTEVERALEAVGFTGVETTVLGEEMVAAAYEQVHARSDTVLPRLRSTCPVAVEWVRRFHPQLTDALVPIAPPYLVQARLVRELYPEDVVIVYVSPCWARKDEVHDSSVAGVVDIAIGFDELRKLLDEGPPVSIPTKAMRRPGAAKQLSVTDGFPRLTLKTSDRTDRDVVSVRGLADIDRTLRAITRGEFAPSVVDMLNCEGCLDGPCVNRDISVFAKRNIDVAERERQPAPPVDSRSFLAALPAVELRRSFTPRPAPVREPSDSEIDAVLQAGEFMSRSETVDCGACGYDTCVEHATAICLGNSTWEMCLPLIKKRLTREREVFAQASITDDLTGLLNRRAFDSRLAEEASRASRYGAPLSLIMLDLDGFKDVNDAYGHAAGDGVLRAVGVLLKAELRGADIPVRYGGDEFAMILPNTPKTDAWAVAEKTRAALRSLRIDLGEGRTASVSASAGVAALGEEHADADALLEAADAALFRAKRAGRDRVELALG